MVPGSEGELVVEADAGLAAAGEAELWAAHVPQRVAAEDERSHVDLPGGSMRIRTENGRNLSF